jgi:hypothetical protein
MNELIAAKNDNAEYSLIVSGWDKLYSYIYANFDHPKNMGTKEDFDQIVEECQQMLKHDIATLLEKLLVVPPDYTDYVFPVAIARHLLRYNGLVRLQLSSSDAGNEFFERYTRLVLKPQICYNYLTVNKQELENEYSS